MPVISTNLAANSTAYYLNNNTLQDAAHLSKLASGSRIVAASDDPSGLAVGTQLAAAVAVLRQDNANIFQGQAILQTADAGLAQISNVLSRMQALAAEAASGQVTDGQRSLDIDTEYQILAQQINVIASQTQYEGSSLLGFNNTISGAFSWQSSSVLSNFYQAQVLRNSQYGTANAGYTAAEGAILTEYTATGSYGLSTATSGAFDAAPLEVSNNAPYGPANFLVGTSSADTMSVTINGANTVYLGLESDFVTYSDQAVTQVYDQTLGTTVTAAQWLASNPTSSLPGIVSTTVVRSVSNVATRSAAATALDTLQNAMNTVTRQRAKLGGYESRFHFTSQSIAQNIDNTAAAASVIDDADVASEKAKLASANVLSNSAVSALTQASLLPQDMLKLIQS